MSVLSNVCMSPTLSLRQISTSYGRSQARAYVFFGLSIFCGVTRKTEIQPMTEIR